MNERQGRRIDLNCDLGESFGVYRLGEDEAILAGITSASIACGFHAGDPHVMRRTVRSCLERGIRIGAHPGLPDLQGFGRRYMQISGDEAYDWTVYQLGALQAFVQAEGGVMQHIKPHGALYNMAALRLDIAEGIAAAVSRVQANLILYASPGSQLEAAAHKFGIQVAREAFADRGYMTDGSLAPRTLQGSVIANSEEAAAQALSLVLNNKVTTIEGGVLTLTADTICLHSDGEHAASLISAVRKALESAGVTLCAFH